MQKSRLSLQLIIYVLFVVFYMEYKMKLLNLSTTSIAGLFGALLVSGCASSYPVTGTIGANERFVGTAHSVAVGESVVRFTTEEGTNCEGQYKASIVMSSKSGSTSQGTFSCDDGRSGTFAVTGNTHSGSGFGKMNNGQKMKIFYGHVSHVHQF